MSGIDYSSGSWHMSVRARMNIGYTGPELDAAMADFADTVRSDHGSNNFDPQDWQSYIGDGNTYGMADNWDTSPGLIGEIWNNGRWDGETGTLDEIVHTALEELACEVVRVAAELLDEEE